MTRRPFLAVALLLAVSSPLLAAEGAVTIAEDDATFTLNNGIVQAMVAKASGDLVSLRFKGLEMLATFTTPDGLPDLKRDPPGENVNGLNRGMTDHQYGFWSHDAMGQRATAAANPTLTRITIDPKSNAGQRGEVSVKGVANARLMGTGPGANGGNFNADIEIRYTLGQGDAGVYTCCQFTHPASYANTSITEARFCAKLNDFFDWMSAGTKYNKPYPKEQERGEDKYTYTTVQSDTPAFGWSSTSKKVGFYCINPSMEYMSGGPTKPEFLGHRDTNTVAAPCVLNYWRSSHYGGASVDVRAGEPWSKVIGPFFLYVNSFDDLSAKTTLDKDSSPSTLLYDDARVQAKAQAAKWPFEWVDGLDYAKKSQRATVSGRLTLSDPQATSAKLPNLQVGLTHAPWPLNAAGAVGGGPRLIDWQQDAKFYQFWARGQDDGTFSIPHVCAGVYTLHAFADGVLGEFAKADIKVEPGKPLDLGNLTWTPDRKGRQLWDVGIPNRNGSEYFKADDYAVLDIALQYAKLFPDDVTYTIGKSDFRKDWFFAQVPHNTDSNARAAPFYGIQSASSKATPYTIVFDVKESPKGRATLRAAISGTGARTVQVGVNDQSIGQLANLPGDGAITRHQIQGIWVEREIAFDAALLKPGTNKLTLTVAGGATGQGNVNNGVIYDYLRLELDATAK
jgi:rhamnogalacturonan endolyase